jgi:Icc-related predicted phosphoesterase
MNNQKIYLTHCGPFDYETSIDRRDLNKIVYGGAVYFNKLMTHKNVLLYLHGHVHNGSRFAK